MDTNELSLKRLSRRIGEVAPAARRVLKDERGETYDERMVAASMRDLIAGKLETLEDDVGEMFTSPARPEFHELAATLERHSLKRPASAVVDAVQLAHEFDDESVFAGKRVFSKEKLAAMIEYLTSRGHHVYKTSLNKLLFYADLTSFFLAGHGMSGAVYYNRRFGPVADPVSPVLTELVADGKVRIDPRMQTLATQSPDVDTLSDTDVKVLDWVAETYGRMSAGEISEYSHNEMAYKYTEPNEPIAYAYARFLKLLPPKDLLGR